MSALTRIKGPADPMTACSAFQLVSRGGSEMVFSQVGVSGLKGQHVGTYWCELIDKLFCLGFISWTLWAVALVWIHRCWKWNWRESLLQRLFKKFWNSISESSPWWWWWWIAIIIIIITITACFRTGQVLYTSIISFTPHRDPRRQAQSLPLCGGKSLPQRPKSLVHGHTGSGAMELCYSSIFSPILLSHFPFQSNIILSPGWLYI